MFTAIDTWLKGAERNQIPMFALTITKPFRLTDAIYKSNYTKVTKEVLTLIFTTYKFYFYLTYVVHVRIIVSLQEIIHRLH